MHTEVFFLLSEQEIGNAGCSYFDASPIRLDMHDRLSHKLGN